MKPLPMQDAPRKIRLRHTNQREQFHRAPAIALGIDAHDCLWLRPHIVASPLTSQSDAPCFADAEAAV